MNDLYLAHHGVKGQRWGIRRYQNFDGSYTAAGLKRYQKAKDAYDESRVKYKEAKASGDKLATQKARNEMRVARAEEKKHYKHLEQDKLGDEGKQLYAEGKRIRPNNRVLAGIKAVGVLGGTAIAVLNHLNILPLTGGDTISVGSLNVPVNAITVSAALLATAGTVYGATAAVKEPQNKRLRAYYAHTSNY